MGKRTGESLWIVNSPSGTPYHTFGNPIRHQSIQALQLHSIRNVSVHGTSKKEQ
ncbi:hypothetical protein SK128_025689, partial [Halocaridina rubra]